jgi:hypothetical protein
MVTQSWDTLTGYGSITGSPLKLGHQAYDLACLSAFAVSGLTCRTQIPRKERCSNITQETSNRERLGGEAQKNFKSSLRALEVKVREKSYSTFVKSSLVGVGYLIEGPPSKT